MRNYDEIYATEYQRVSTDYLEDLKEKIEDLKIELETVTEDLKYFLKHFIEKGNKKDKTLEHAYAEMFEIYKEYEDEKYIK